jgi:hypothetical protein
MCRAGRENHTRGGELSVQWPAAMSEGVTSYGSCNAGVQEDGMEGAVMRAKKEKRGEMERYASVIKEERTTREEGSRVYTAGRGRVDREGRWVWQVGKISFGGKKTGVGSQCMRQISCKCKEFPTESVVRSVWKS